MGPKGKWKIFLHNFLSDSKVHIKNFIHRTPHKSITKCEVPLYGDYKISLTDIALLRIWPACRQNTDFIAIKNDFGTSDQNVFNYYAPFYLLEKLPSKFQNSSFVKMHNFIISISLSTPLNTFTHVVAPVQITEIIFCI